MLVVGVGEEEGVKRVCGLGGAPPAGGAGRGGRALCCLAALSAAARRRRMERAASLEEAPPPRRSRAPGAAQPLLRAAALLAALLQVSCAEGAAEELQVDVHPPGGDPVQPSAVIREELEEELAVWTYIAGGSGTIHGVSPPPPLASAEGVSATTAATTTADGERSGVPGEEPPPLFAHYHVTHHAGTAIWSIAKQALYDGNSDGMNGIFNLGTKAMRSHCRDHGGHAPACVPLPNETDVEPDAFSSPKWGAPGSPDRDVFAGVSREWEIKRWRTLTASADKSWYHKGELDGTIEPDGSMRRWVSIEMPMYAYAWSVFPWGEGPRRRISTMTAVRHPLNVMLSNSRDDQRAKPERLQEAKNKDNFALRWFSGNTDLGVPVSEPDPERAADRLARFDNVAVVEALADTLRFMCDDWDWKVCDPSGKKKHHSLPRVPLSDEAEGSRDAPAEAVAPARKAAEIIRGGGMNASAFGHIVEYNALTFRLYDIGVEMARSRLRARGQSSETLDALPRDSLAEARALAAEWLANEQSAAAAAATGARTAAESPPPGTRRRGLMSERSAWRQRRAGRA